MVEFEYQGEPVETPVKDLSDRYNSKLSRRAQATAYKAFLETGVMDEDHRAFIEKAEAIVARFDPAAK